MLTVTFEAGKDFFIMGCRHYGDSIDLSMDLVFMHVETERHSMPGNMLPISIGML